MYIEKIVKGKNKVGVRLQCSCLPFNFEFFFFSFCTKSNGIQKLLQNLSKFSKKKKVVKENMHDEELFYAENIMGTCSPQVRDERDEITCSRSWDERDESTCSASLDSLRSNLNLGRK